MNRLLFAGCMPPLVVIALLIASACQSALATPGAAGETTTQYGQLQVLSSPRDHVSPSQRAALIQAQRAGLKQLEALGLLSKATSAAGSLTWPVRTAPGSLIGERWAISNFVDHNPAFPDQVLDYQCGARSYDTAAGYNHAGVDIFTIPYSWQAMAQDAQEVIAAAPGTLVARMDGQFDRNCSFDVAEEPNYVILRHDDGSVAWYLHMKSGSVIDAPLGSRIEAGERLGVVGSSGISTAPHLHFELRSSDGLQTLDPFEGLCQTAPTRWAMQPDYRDPRILSVDSYDAVPGVAGNCGEFERPNMSRRFEPGDTLYLAGFFRDMQRGQTFTVELIRPDGEPFHTWVIDPSADMNVEYYSAAYWYLNATLPADAPSGVWRQRWSYGEHSSEGRLLVGGAELDASGAWYDSANPGHGLIVEVIDIGASSPQLALTWYVYENGIPLWLVGLAPLQDGATEVAVSSFTGAEFPPHYDPAQRVGAVWGTVTFEMTDADHAHVSWQRSEDSAPAEGVSMSRLTRPADINDDDFDSGARACMSGAWYNPEQSGHGLFAEVLETPSGRLLAVAWYAYHDGKPFWLAGAGAIENGVATVTLGASTTGQFPPEFDQAESAVSAWGTLEWEFTGISQSVIRWQTDAEGFEDGQLELRRLTALALAPCL